MTELFTFVQRDSSTIRDNILRSVRLGLIARGVSNPNVSPGSDLYIKAQALANQLAVIEANATIKADQIMPDTALGEDLARICTPRGLSKQPAAGSIGTVVLDSSQDTTIATGDQLIDGAGLSYEVYTGGIYSDGDLVPIRAISTGKDTNHAEDDVLRWVNQPAYANSKALVGPGGLVNGIDAEDDEVLRARLYEDLQTPAGSANSGHIIKIAEASTPSVQKAFCMPALQGASTYHVAVTAAPTASNKSRVVASATMVGTVTPYIQGNLPEGTYSITTTVADVNTDVAFGLTIPEASTANPPGPGGGWKDATPWPAPDASTTWKCAVSAVTSDSVFTVDATSSPTANVTHIAWLSPYDWKLYQAVVIAVSGSSGAYTITLDKTFKGITAGSLIWPDCENAQAYCDAVVAAYALMGPGEKTSNASLLVRGFRRPRPTAGWPMTLGGHLTRALTSKQSEVESAQFFYRTDGTTALNGSSGLVYPQLPSVISDPPKQFIPRHLAFYRVPQ